MAALVVLAWHSLHANQIVPTSYVPSLFPLGILEEGHTGVSLFMTLSGFIFHALCRDSAIHYSQFILNRVLRIAPLFVVWTLFYFYTMDIDSAKLFVALVGLMNNGVVPGVGWTIIVEFQFYALFPFLFLFARRYGLAYLLGLVLLAMMFRLGVWYTHGSVQSLSYVTIFGHIDQFLLGMIGSELCFRFPRQLGRVPILVLLVAVWLFLYNQFNFLGGFYHLSEYPSRSPLWVVLPTAEGLFYSLITASYLSLEQALPNVVDRALAWLGTLSYSFYLNHVFVIGICIKLCAESGWIVRGFGQGLAFTFLVALPAVVAVSAVTYRLIEVPFLSMRRPYLSKEIQTTMAGRD